MPLAGFAALLSVVGNILDAKPAQGRRCIKDVAQNVKANVGVARDSPQVGEKDAD